MVEREAFVMKPKHQLIYRRAENEFVEPNHEMRGDYHVNPSLCQLENEL